MECYYFCQQCEDHFEVVGSLGHKRVSFATRFLKDYILNWWQQHKTGMQCNRLAPMTWDEFKAFLRKSLGESNTFVGHVWSKLRGDAQHQLEDVQDWAAYLEHSRSILLEFDANNTSREGQLGRTFYDGLRPRIKLWITNIGDNMPWDDLIRVANKAEARVKIQKSTHLDQQCPKEKRPLNMSLNLGTIKWRPRRPRIRPTRLNKSPRPKSPLKRPGKNNKRRVARDGAKGQLLQLELIPLQQPQVVSDKKRRWRPEMSQKSPAIVITKRVTILPIVPSQKTSCSLGDLHVGDC